MPVGNSTVQWPLANIGALVNRVHATGGVKFGVQYKFVAVSVILPRQAIVRVELFADASCKTAGPSGGVNCEFVDTSM